MKVSYAKAEQRREAREDLSIGQLLVVDLVLDRPKVRTRGIVLNMSRGGMAVQTFRPLGQGRITNIQLSHPQATFSVGQCQVAWENPGGLAGIRFMNAPLTALPELPQATRLDSSHPNPEISLPLLTCRNPSSTSEVDTTLHLLACTAMALTGATGAAIAIGNGDGMECRASVGSAPEVGTELRPDNGVTGQSMRTGAVILCSDTWSDSRVNTVAAQQMETRSIIIIPITVAGTVAGLLEAFSRDLNFFDESHVRQLQPLVKLLAESINEQMGNNTHPQPAQESLTPAIPTLERETPTSIYFSAYSRLGRRSQVAVIVTSTLAILLVLIILWSTSLNRTRSPRSKTVAKSAQPSSNWNDGQGGVSTAKPMVSFNPPLIEQKVGATFGVDVVLKGARNVWSAPMQILYDPKKLAVITVTSGNLLERDGQAATLVKRVDSTTGRIDVSISRPLSAPGISGDGVVFTLVFLGKALGSSRLRVDQTSLRDTSTKAVSLNSADATVTISKLPTPTEVTKEQSTAKARTLIPPPAGFARSNVPDESIQPLLDHQNLRRLTPEKPSTIANLLSPTQPDRPELKLPAVEATAALAPQSAVVPSFVLDHTLNAHSNWVTAVAFSTDGQHLVSGSWDHSIKMWDVRTGHALTTIATKNEGMQASALSHDGRLIAAEDASNNIRIWNVRTGREVGMMKGDRPPWDQSWAYSIAFSPDDSLLAAALDGKTVRLWDVNSGRAVRDVTGSSRSVIYAAFSPNGRWLATGGDSKTIEILDVHSGDVLRTLRGHKQDVNAVAFSPDGKWLASASKDKTVKIWDVSTGREVHSLTGHQNSVTSLAFSPNSRWLVTSGWDKTVKIWDVAAGREVQTLTGNTHQIYSLAFGSHGGWLATGSADGKIKLWRLRKEIDLAVLGEGNAADSSPAVAQK